MDISTWVEYHYLKLLCLELNDLKFEFAFGPKSCLPSHASIFGVILPVFGILFLLLVVSLFWLGLVLARVGVGVLEQAEWPCNFIPTSEKSSFFVQCRWDIVHCQNGSWQSWLEHVVWALPVSLPLGTLNLELSEQRNMRKKKKKNGEIWMVTIHWQCGSRDISALFLDDRGPVIVTADDSDAS